MTPEEVETRACRAHRAGDARHSAPAPAALHLQVRLTDITLDFEDGTDIYWARQQVGERLAAVMGNLPPAPAAAWHRSPRRSARCSCSPSRATCPLAEKRALLDWVIRPQLRTVPAWPTSIAWAARCAPSKSCPTRRLAARGLALGAAGRWKPTTATTAPGASTMARKPCWCAPKAPSDPRRRARHRFAGQAGGWSASAMWPRCVSAP
jgi:hypothetical protein